MSHFCTPRTPRARIDPIDCEADALAVIRLAIAEPPRDEIIAVVLDHERRGIGFLVVGRASDADDVFQVIDMLISKAAGSNHIGGFLLASCRVDGDVLCGDVERWMEASGQCEAAGLELVEWFVIGRRIECPRDLIGEPPRWGRR